MNRDTEPLKRKSMHLFVETAESVEDPVKGLTALFLTFTGVRNDTFGHLHSDWFKYDDERLKVKIPPNEVCTKRPEGELCGICQKKGKDGFSPKTTAGEGRVLTIPEKWHNHYSDEEQQDLPLRTLIEHHFSMTENDPGYDVVDGNGLSPGTVNKYIKEVADEAQIGFHRKTGYTNHSLLGRVPDITPHDLRGSYCVQLCRNDANPWKMCKKTGHKDVDSLKPYVKFAEQEFSGNFEQKFI